MTLAEDRAETSKELWRELALVHSRCEDLEKELANNSKRLRTTRNLLHERMDFFEKQVSARVTRIYPTSHSSRSQVQQNVESFRSAILSELGQLETRVSTQIASIKQGQDALNKAAADAPESPLKTMSKAFDSFRKEVR